MKRTLALILAAILLAAALASCATAPKAAISARIRVTSSDGEDAAAWLTARLGDKLTDRVVVGTEADGYGVDVSALEDDGHIIRSLGGEDVLFAKTADGLDRAVRKYAKMVEAGAVSDVTYHEGYRVERLTIAGADVSEFAIRVECGDDYLAKTVTDNTANALSRLLGMACGFAPQVGGEAKHYIVLRRTDDPAFRESSYRYYVDGGDLVIEFAGLFGSKNGAVMFLQDELGWSDLISGYDELAEAEHIDVAASLDVTVHPLLPGGICQTTAGAFGLYGTSLKNVNGNLFRNGYRIETASHYLGNLWGGSCGYDVTGHLICLTDEFAFGEAADDITYYIEDRLDAGDRIGVELVSVNLGMEDHSAWCKCRACVKVYREEGNTWAGPMVRFANRLEEELDERGYDGLKYPIFAYSGSNPPPKSAPNDDIYVTLVLHDACDKHLFDGSQCGDGDVGSSYMVSINRTYTNGERQILSNVDWGEWIRGWNDLGAHLYIRVATLCNMLRPFMTMYTIYDNMKFFAENGCMAIYNETYSCDGLDLNCIVHELYQIAYIRPELTRADFFAEYRRLLEKYYGDGWRGVLAFTDNAREAELAGPCRSAWEWDWTGQFGQYDPAAFAASFDETLASLDGAIRAANCARQEHFCKMAKCAAIYMGCSSEYYLAYNAYDDAAIAHLSALWSEMVAMLDEGGFRIYDDASKLDLFVGFAALRGSALFFPEQKIGVGWNFSMYMKPDLEDFFWGLKRDAYKRVLDYAGIPDDCRRPAP